MSSYDRQTCVEPCSRVSIIPAAHLCPVVIITHSQLYMFHQQSLVKVPSSQQSVEQQQLSQLDPFFACSDFVLSWSPTRYLTSWGLILQSLVDQYGCNLGSNKVNAGSTVCGIIHRQGYFEFVLLSFVAWRAWFSLSSCDGGVGTSIYLFFQVFLYTHHMEEYLPHVDRWWLWSTMTTAIITRRALGKSFSILII